MLEPPSESMKTLYEDRCTLGGYSSIARSVHQDSCVCHLCVRPLVLQHCKLCVPCACLLSAVHRDLGYDAATAVRADPYACLDLSTPLCTHALHCCIRWRALSTAVRADGLQAKFVPGVVLCADPAPELTTQHAVVYPPGEGGE